MRFAIRYLTEAELWNVVRPIPKRNGSRGISTRATYMVGAGCLVIGLGAEHRSEPATS